MASTDKKGMIGAGLLALGLVGAGFLAFNPHYFQGAQVADIRTADGGDAPTVSAAIPGIDRLDISTANDELAALETRMQRKLEKLGSDLSRVTLDNQRLRALLEQQTTQADPLDNLEDGYDEMPSLTPEEQMQRRDEEMSMYVAALGHTVESEAIDPEWFNQAQDSLWGTFTDEKLPGLDPVKIECRSTLCRLEVSVSDAGGGQESLENISHAMPWSGAGFYHQEGDQVIVYLAREGEPLQPMLQ